MTAYILDTETTGGDDAHATEIAYVPVTFEGAELQHDGEAFNERFNPLVPISPMAMATTGICDEDVVDKKPHTSFKLPEDIKYIIGHNIDYDCDVLARAGNNVTEVKRICTLALARSLYPELSNHTLGAMLYHLHYHTARKHYHNAHSAKYDVWFTQLILNTMCQKIGVKDFELLYKFSEIARVPKVVSFGKHKGTTISDLPLDYAQWLIKQPDLDKYLEIALQKRLSQDAQ